MNELTNVLRNYDLFSYSLIVMLVIACKMYTDGGAVFAATQHKICFPVRKTFVLFAAGKAQEKQIELARKLEIAKQQHQVPLITNTEVSANLTDVVPLNQTKSSVSTADQMEMKRSEFSLLLAQFKPPANSKETYQSSQIQARKSPISKLTPSKKERSKKAPRTKTDVSVIDDVPLEVGGKAQRVHFEALIDTRIKQPLGSMGAAKLVPWVPPFRHQNVIIVVDPRKQSSDFRTAIQYLEGNDEIKTAALTSIIGITSDTAEEVNAYVS
jgi:hypothetical protein